MDFVHLRTHSEYSVVDGTLRVDAVAQAAARDGQGALALTDLANTFGAIKFYRACREAGVKPLIGADLWLEPPTLAGTATSPSSAGDKAASRLLVLVQDHRGWLNLCELLSRAWLQHVQRNQAWVKWEWLQELGGGLIALSGADQGAVGAALLAGDRPRAEALAQRLSALFPGRFYIELQRAELPQNEAHVRAAVPLAAALQLPVVATHPVQFLEPEDFEAHEARVCVAEGELLDNQQRPRRFTREQHFKPRADMARRFADVPSALANTVEIARRCNLVFTLGKAQLPDFQTPEVNGQRLPLNTYFARLSHEGLQARLLQLYPQEAERERQRAQYVQRLDFEIATIEEMGFAGYFLIVSDFIVWAKANGCPVGPGRGSGAGSLVAYALSITDLDPIRYQLLFERFLNPERVSMPDFDIDFCQANRDRVIEYVKDKYGRAAVSQIATFGTMAAKAALRDVGRVLGMSYGHVDSIAKLIPAPPGRTVTLAPVPPDFDPDKDSTIYARREAPELNQREAAEEEVRSLLQLATRVEGIVRNVGMHAGGVLIAPGRITDFCPLYQQPGSDSAVSQFDKDDVEAIGLVKFDFLGLATLTILELAREFIRARRPGREQFSFEALPLDDPRVYKLFAEGRTEAIFQFESRGMVNMLRDAQPTRLEDLIALNAMFRPGPMENIPEFCARKNGRQAVSTPHPLLEPILAETYGIFVYQEQVMQAAQVLAGYSLGGADVLRRAMGKKKPEEMAKQRQTFRDGAAQAHGIEAAEADRVFDLMEKFAGYGFNKSHSAAYALLAYHTAWLKVHCPAEFYAANMSVEQDNTDKLELLLRDAELLNVSIDPPCINQGSWRFEPISDHRVRYSLAAIKGTGRSAIEAIVAAREGAAGSGGGPFHSLFDFCARVDRKAVNKRAVEALVKAGAFDVITPDRAALLASVGLAFEWAEAQEAHAQQAGLFDFGDDAHGSSTQEPGLVATEPFGVRDKLMHEKAALGFYLSGHLFEVHAEEVRRFVRTPLAELADQREPQLAAGIVRAPRFITNTRGRVCIFRLEDGSESLEAVVGEELWNNHRELLVEDGLVIMQARVQADHRGGGPPRLMANALWGLPAARARFGRHLAVEVRGQHLPLADVLRHWPVRRLNTELGEISQGLAIRVHVLRPQCAGVIDLGEDARFWPCDEALARWRSAELPAQVVYEAG
jgi:DNA polymerase III subunit alpha